MARTTRFFTIQQAARIAECDVRTIARWIAAGRLSIVRYDDGLPTDRRVKTLINGRSLGSLLRHRRAA
jgi:hypothetical protein